MNDNGARPVLIMAGGTGGHVFPALAVAERLRAREVPVLWLGTETGLEARVVPAAGIDMEWLAVSGIRGKGAFGWIKAPFMVLRALGQALAVFRRHRPRVVLGMGGYVSGPGALAARLTGTPLIIHEQNAVPGMTNRQLLRFANRVVTGFDAVFPEREDAVWVGNPVRAAIARLPAPSMRSEQQQRRPRLLVVGGSQGARVLNEIVPAALQCLPAGLRPEVRHQAGGSAFDVAQTAYREAGIEAEVEPFIEDMAQAYGWADLAICRAGALTVAELAASGTPAVLVPFPHAVDDHQTANARHLVNRDAAVLCSQDQLTPERLAVVLEELLADREHLLTMARNARSMARPNAAEEVAEMCLEIAK
ncbi:undecaprenyldiphospho-muramoylpentapeptide beta-N-acetylglucosaminyltransferase [Alkalilimnicola ehrlichii]|uniref:UDP-N-acetylglucosamine--N-acetylmuramyl-(pentapeptide) pyrophosphoryl-undecaprenol N-acetylglucosamine transferase n=1 Tax=Alkalilimnicola ehrlichii TaxID=351052 RepID=A0A3E0WZT9_9GAMM|nr:undecaprenyldiphospho-muramoylpentapeptide beta-N-acetylglucosaminyltransferase [Alkalilimnicola ehrlichii]RFA30324.1 undecaprenyldiphospho-muramoylpentapeptide beta-N-acetylglucosaminyltransferase [Alkalilimnicola ehrlichii]RFA37899.1 undecaprenyldiphospho-muramoylpentapeptide beta-N-acetylglucosaminyltransferase [Alkalilimnicola ehrlichii]